MNQVCAAGCARSSAAVSTDADFQVLRWIQPQKGRYYEARLMMDLLGDWTLLRCWGSLWSHRGGRRIVQVLSLADGQRRLRALSARRRRRGYVQQS